jgi:sacsin
MEYHLTMKYYIKVYNWTDGPTILSGNSLLLLDPHHYWSPDVHQPGGPLYDFVADSTDPAMVNQLSPFRRHVSSFSQSFDGTVIRLPLRTAEQASRSEIIQRRDRKPTTVDDIKEAFMSYATEISESLLFLRHISSITLKIGDTVFAKAVGRKFHGAKDVTNAFSIEEPYSSVLIRGDKPQKDEQFVMEISFQKQGALHVSRYAITHHMRHKADNPELQKWARSYKLFPWVAVAFPMSYVCCRSIEVFEVLAKEDHRTTTSGDDSSALCHFLLESNTRLISMRCFR